MRPRPWAPGPTPDDTSPAAAARSAPGRSTLISPLGAAYRPPAWAACALWALTACASTGEGASAPAASTGTGKVAPDQVTTVQHVDRVTSPPPVLVGKRCPAGQRQCQCRTPGDDAEAEPPPAGQKRLEIRLSVLGGEGAVESPTVGRFPASGVADACYYVDVLAGSKAHFAFSAKASNPDTGLTPRLTISEYGPKGPYWYEIFAFECVGLAGKCDQAGVQAWTGRLQGRKRGRVDPCGSLVITGLDWETSGGLAHRDSGLYRDFSVRFDAEVKKFPTQFAPHSTECIPK